MHPYAITGPLFTTRPDAAPGLTPLPTRTQRTRPGPGRQDTSCMLGPRDTAPADARATVRLTLTTWGLAHVSAEAETVISELVTNACTASRNSAPEGTDPRPITFRLTASGWGSYGRNGGKVVWAGISLASPPPADPAHPAPAGQQKSAR
jgi:hypothetical protein